MEESQLKIGHMDIRTDGWTDGSKYTDIRTDVRTDGLKYIWTDPMTDRK